jgi:hypothetical protein
VTGSFAIQRFARATDDTVAAVGTLTLSVTDPASEPRTIVTQVPMRVAKAAAIPTPGVSSRSLPPRDATPQQAPGPSAQTCETLSLVLTPQELDVVGLPIQLDAANIDVTAVRGAGGQLANLLCAVTGLFDGAAPATELVKALNTVLATIG